MHCQNCPNAHCITCKSVLNTVSCTAVRRQNALTLSSEICQESDCSDATYNST